MTRARLALLLVILLWVSRAAAADEVKADTSLAATRSLLEPARRPDRDSGFEFSADVMIYSQHGDSVVLRGSPARITHGEARLEAAELVYRRTAGIVEARARSDSTGQQIGEAVLTRGDETLRGARIVYDVEAEQGSILRGRIQREQGFFAGERIRTVSAEQFHVAEGSYTTCDYPDPHFDFYSPRIKVLTDEMAIARPVYLRIYQRRVLWIPFYIFSLRSDRQSGFLTPSFENRPVRFGSAQTEWELRNLGYYLAPNDYYDITLAANLRQRSGWLARADLAYAVRYRMSGSADLQYERRRTGDQIQQAWRLDLTHNQDLSPSSQLRATGAFQSNKTFVQDNSSDLQDRLDRTLRSNFNYTRRWRGSGNSLNLSASQTRNLDTERATVVLPEMRFVKARKPLFGSGTTRAGDRRTAWYQRIYYSGNARMQNRKQESTADTSHTTLVHAALNASSQHNPTPYLQLSPRLALTWQDNDLRTSQQRPQSTTQLSGTASLMQNIYGVFPTEFWRILATRHELSPSLSMTYAATRTDTGGVYGVGGTAGSWEQRRRLEMRVNNAFWARIAREQDETRVRLAQLNFSTAYDFDARNRPFSDLTAALNMTAGRILDTRLTARYDLYDDADRLQLLSPRLRQIEVNTGFRYTALGVPDPPSLRRTPGLSPTLHDRTDRATSSLPDRTAVPAGTGVGTRRARITHGQLTHYYSRTAYSHSTVHRSWLRASLGLTLGTAHYLTESRPRWRIDYSVNYGLHAPGTPLFSADRITSESLAIQRDFHDWTATLRIEPASFQRNRAFYFRAQLRDIPQIKLERGDARL